MEEIRDVFEKPTERLWDKTWVKVLFVILLLFFLLFIVFFIYVFSLVQRGVVGSIPSQDNLKLPENSILATLPYVNRSDVEQSDDPWFGDVNAKIVLVEFADFQCPFCKKSVAPLKMFLEHSPYPIKVIYRDFPVFEAHPFAFLAAQAGQCAHDQGKFEEMHDLIFENQKNITSVKLQSIAGQVGLDVAEFSSCLSSHKYQQEVVDDLKDGFRLGVQGTPTWFINGYRVPGVFDPQLFARLVSELGAF